MALRDTDNALFTRYRSIGGTLSIQQWIAAGKPNGPTTDIRSDDVGDSVTEVLASLGTEITVGGGVDTGEADTDITVVGLTDPLTGATTDPTVQPPDQPIGGTDQIPTTLPIGGGALGTGDFAFTGDPGEFGFPGKQGGISPIFENPDGTFGHGLNDKIFLNREDAFADYNATTESQAAQAAFQTELGVFQQNIQDIGAREAAQAQRLSARNVGQQTRGITSALLASGRTPGEIAQLSAGGIEASQRGLADLLVNLNLQTQRAEAGAQQFGLTGALTQEQLASSRQALASQQSQFQQNLAEQSRQFSVSSAFSQQQLAEQARQFNKQLAAQPTPFEQGLIAFGGGLGQALPSLFFGG